MFGNILAAVAALSVWAVVCSAPLQAMAPIVDISTKSEREGEFVRVPVYVIVGNAAEHVSPQLSLSRVAHDLNRLSSGSRSYASKKEGPEKKKQSPLSGICHSILGADIGVLASIVALLVFYGWFLAVERCRPIAGGIVLALSILTFMINKADAERALCGEVVELPSEGRVPTKATCIWTAKAMEITTER